MLTCIQMDKKRCITKEKLEEMYKTNEDFETRKDLSVGEDLETFVSQIKNGEVNKSSFSRENDWIKTFMLCLLDKEERKKLEQRDSDFMKTFTAGANADVPEEDWKASESNLKFSEWSITRKTYFFDQDSDTFNDRRWHH